MPASGGSPEAIANAIASGSATSPTVTPAVTSAPNAVQEYCRSAMTSLGTRPRRGSGAAGGRAPGAREATAVVLDIAGGVSAEAAVCGRGRRARGGLDKMPRRGGRPVTRALTLFATVLLFLV